MFIPYFHINLEDFLSEQIKSVSDPGGLILNID